jgi:serine/threonine protein kinase
VKLFDFGLAKELDPDALGYSETYELSGNTGSLRYMSPEVALSEPYNLSADTYSFGLLLWQICSLQLPYDGMSRLDHSELVVYGNQRPPLDPSWSTPIRILMKRAWEPDPSMRPTMDSIYKILKREICALRDGDDSGLENVRRRSTFVLNRDSAANPTNKRGGRLPPSGQKSLRNLRSASIKNFRQASQAKLQGHIENNQKLHFGGLPPGPEKTATKSSRNLLREVYGLQDGATAA